ncbi:MAG: WbqC family protein [Allomuricauda sp.]
MKTVLHPAYFPNLASFAVLIQKKVIWEMHDNFQKQTYRNRCYICTDRGKHMLNIPIKHVGGTEGRQKYIDIKIDDSYNWRKLHWRTLETAYRTSPFFEFYEDDIRPLYEKRESSLFEFNLKTIKVIADCLGVEISFEKTRVYEKEITQNSDVRFLIKAKKEPNFLFQQYSQVFEERHNFVSNLSILDLLFNEGTNALNYLKNQSLDFLDA